MKSDVRISIKNFEEGTAGVSQSERGEILRCFKYRRRSQTARYNSSYHEDGFVVSNFRT